MSREALEKDYPNLKLKSEKQKPSLTLRQKKLLKTDFFRVFNEVHNSHLLSTSVGEVNVKTEAEIHKQESKKRD